MISIVCPTITGREHWLERCQIAYCETTDTECEFIVIKDATACGIAWNQGCEEARGDYIHFTADDIEPTPGWWEVGIEWIKKGVLPAPRILNTDGTLQSCGDNNQEWPTGAETVVARIPFCSREQMERIFPIIDVHYWTDYDFTRKGKALGWPSIVVRDFLFYHHYAPEGRLDERLAADQKVFNAAG